MASQYVSDVKCHCSLSHRQSYGYHHIQHQHNNMVREKGATNNRGRKQAQKLQRLGFSYLASSFIYLAIKVKAFYNGFLGDVAGEAKMGIEPSPMTTEPYFSMPVIAN